jgi:hypothetical protein
MVAAPDLRHLPVIRLSFLILQREIDTKYPGFSDKLISSKVAPSLITAAPPATAITVPRTPYRNRSGWSSLLPGTTE